MRRVRVAAPTHSTMTKLDKCLSDRRPFVTTATFHPSRRTDPHRTARAATWWGAAAIVLAVATVALVGGIVTAPAVQTWYADLARPAWTPPNWVFAPVWGILYAMMAAAAVLVWARRDRSEICCPLGAFAIQ